MVTANSSTFETKKVNHWFPMRVTSSSVLWLVMNVSTLRQRLPEVERQSSSIGVALQLQSSYQTLHNGLDCYSGCHCWSCCHSSSCWCTWRNSSHQQHLHAQSLLRQEHQADMQACFTHLGWLLFHNHGIKHHQTTHCCKLWSSLCRDLNGQWKGACFGTNAFQVLGTSNHGVIDRFSLSSNQTAQQSLHVGQSEWTWRRGGWLDAPCLNSCTHFSQLQSQHVY